MMFAVAEDEAMDELSGPVAACARMDFIGTVRLLEHINA